MSTEAIDTGHPGLSPVAAEAVAMGSMAMVAGAAGVASFLHAGLSVEAATSVSVLALSAFMANHLIMSRPTNARSNRQPRTRDYAKQAVAAARGSREAQHELEVAMARAAAEPSSSRLSIAPDVDVRDDIDRPLNAAEHQDAQRLSAALAHALTIPPADEPHDNHVGLSSWSYRPAQEPTLPDAQMTRSTLSVEADNLARVLPDMPETDIEGTPAVEQASPVAAPAAPVMAQAAQIAPAAPVMPPPLPPVAARMTLSPPPVPKSQETEVITGLLKRLATQIEAGQREPQERVVQESPAVVWAREHFGQKEGLESIDDAVDALSSAVNTMRASLDKKSEPPLPQPQAAAADPARARLEAVADAIAAERLEVFLEPILGLRQHRAQHFTVSVRLRTADGETLDAPRIIEAAAGSGLLSVFDALRVKRASRVAGRLEANQRPGSVFSEVTGESMTDDVLLQDVQRGRVAGDVLPERLVLSFRQEDLRLFSPMQWRTLASLREEGFRFAIEDVTHLGMDFEGLASMGFTFVKLDANVFLQGLPMGESMLPAADVCRHFAGHGMAVVVTGIGDDSVHARVMGFGALFGQGTLFGAPRPVKATGRNLGGGQAVA